MTAISRFKITSRAVLLGLSLIAIPASATVACAENLLDVAPKSTPPEINNFKLTEDFLTHMEKIQEQLGSMELSATEDEGQDAAPFPLTRWSPASRQGRRLSRFSKRRTSRHAITSSAISR
ncbi:conserved hypothetical protein [Brucella abortus bv. 4 str. 292]|nr:hypothetical protein BAA13334_I00891 [Brucella abortus A13334]ASU70979.1 hypothetical protein CJP69_01245 [Brucella abortus]EEW80038.1 conserved hypothetical protein [Brucella abortus NCTC 8038]EEX56099.1 conserved hypothetical protein [Brucella abortus bv. 4 str. 292]EEX57818.1 conserved hypothetical protein [Brucella abortus bv. 2 str. 86/8/59]EEX62545.1 conserved hypothetical protein [Brucella abortus bv. 6 str. 870]EEX81239.1 conserved hypothetical protein [Brucella abortus bv. 9 str. 